MRQFRLKATPMPEYVQPFGASPRMRDWRTLCAFAHTPVWHRARGGDPYGRLRSQLADLNESSACQAATGRGTGIAG